LIPALQSSRTDLSSAMKSGEADQTRKRFFGRNALVVVQIAGSLVLMAAATQFHRAFTDQLARNQGFRIDHRMTMRFDPTLLGYTSEQTAQFYKTLIERAQQAPGIKSAALSLSLPMTYHVQMEKVIPEGYSFPPGKETIDVMADVVDEHYFETFGVPLISGRGFQATDTNESPRVVVVNESFARQYLGGNPIGKRLRLNDKNGEMAEVVGVTVTGKRMTLIEPPRQFVYLPFSQHPVSRMTMIAETAGEPSAMAGTLTQVVHSIDPNMPLLRVRSMDTIFNQGGVKMMELVGTIYTSAGFLGIVLATVGLYAIVAYGVARRTREIGIRIAIGAEKAQVVKMILKQAVMMAVPGIAIGLVLSIAANRFLSAALGAPRFNTGLLALVALALFTTTLAAAAVPALRASRIDPQQALRQD
jgi:predicted permease